MKKIWKVLIIMTGLLAILAAVDRCGGGGGGGGTAAVTIQPVACPSSNSINVVIHPYKRRERFLMPTRAESLLNDFFLRKTVLKRKQEKEP